MNFILNGERIYNRIHDEFIFSIQTRLEQVILDTVASIDEEKLINRNILMTDIKAATFEGNSKYTVKVITNNLRF